ncbi:MAG: bifunctional phosphopantothenoylcysteine decarboxylase/phosphopantothenate--cysteine ligase CoaBC [Desulfobacterales bacterium]|nr:bifunctional phosphopantothenoylcysteine decarboxylase/phosphopantothenate--cysteine ligase CoaBC [Desulfobacterales bacterium]
MTQLKGKEIVLGITGGIAAYKSVEVLRLLQKAGADVRVVMTRNAEWFVGRMTFEAISGHPVFIEMFGEQSDPHMRHIFWAETADAVVIAPATADIIGKLANGIADDALSTFMMAVTAPKLICPSMNTHMYESPAVQRNLQTLQDDGYIIVAPGAGELACGTVGAGRLPEPEQIVESVGNSFLSKDYKGRRIVVTAGPTREPIDPVRFVSNPSSGKMGYAVARAAASRGAEVVLVAGPTAFPDPPGVRVVRVGTASEMAQAVFNEMDAAQAVIKVAAVSDYRPVEAATQKMKKNSDELVVKMEKTEDILESLGQRKKNQVLVGFAAETEDLEKNAVDKLKRKNLDLIVGNLIGAPDAGFESDTNRMKIFFRDGSVEDLPLMDKDEAAHVLLDRIGALNIL